MSRTTFVDRVSTPSTVDSLVEEFHRAGVSPGATVLVHASLSAIGFVCGGAVAVVEALVRSVGESGTIVVPTHTGDLSEPSRWRNPPVPEAWWETIRSRTPAFDPAITPTYHMGAVADVLRSWPGAKRSAHPNVSFAAVGARAHEVCGSHALELSMGDRSPLGRVYDLDGLVLLLGVGFDHNTSFHLAECRAAVRPEVEEGAPVLEDGKRVWRTYRDIAYDDSCFAEIGTHFTASGAVQTGQVGAAITRLFRQRAGVDFAVAWLSSLTIRRAEEGGGT
jgi:aminoglycoside 3-N-acetyltransferase